MDRIANLLSTLLEHNPWAVWVGLALGTAAALKTAAEGIALLKKRRDPLLDIQTKADVTGIQLSDATREAIQDSLETRAFQLATGIAAEGRARGELLDLKRSLPASTTWFEVKQAWPYVDAARKNVNIPVHAWLLAVGALLVGLLLALLSVLFLTLLATAAGTAEIGVGQLIGALLLAFLLLGGAGIFWREWWPVWKARKIGKDLALARPSAENGPVGTNEQPDASSGAPRLAKPAQLS